MKISLQQLVLSTLSIAVAVAIVITISDRPAELGSQALIVRALIFSASILFALIGFYPFNPAFSGKPLLYSACICLPALLPVFVYYLLILPQQAEKGLEAQQLASELITDSSSNGLVEVGFSYPIYTPTVSIRNSGLFTEEVNVFLRMTDGNGTSSLFRAIRRSVPGTGLSVESSIRGLLSEKDGVLFLPLRIPPMSHVTGQLVFIISNLDDGLSFADALASANQASFEVRDPETGGLIVEFSLNHI